MLGSNSDGKVCDLPAATTMATKRAWFAETEDAVFACADSMNAAVTCYE
jgi:hypothetical protein